MQIIPEQVIGISHPFISDMYLKIDQRRNQNVLVIQAKAEREDTEIQLVDPVLDIITDLEDLKLKAEQQVGHFDRVDIRTH